MSIDGTFTEPRQTRGTLALSFGLATVFTLFLFGLLTAGPAHAATFTVNSTGDENDLDFPGGTFDGSSDGRCDVDAGTTGNQCTLRAAIQAANKRRGADTIAFNIPESGVQTISPGSALPTITKRVTIDGYTQSGAQKNTLTEPDKTNAVLMIQLSGGGLVLTNGASNSVIKGLAIGGCSNFLCLGGIRLAGGKGYKIQGNFLGTGADGTTPQANDTGIDVQFTSGSTIGGTDADDGRLDGVVEARNIISGNTVFGVFVEDNSPGNRIEGNLIGTDKNGGSLGNGFEGVAITSSGNTGNRILSNSIYSNTGFGIDLDNDGVTANDARDPDTGPNRLQNYPLITSAQTFGSFTSISGTLDSTPSVKRKIRRNGKVRTRVVRRSFTIQFFSSPDKDPSGFGEGKTFLGQVQVTTDLQGQASFSFAPNQVVPVGQFVTATATRMTTGDTSEFSEARIVEEPVIGP